jgi:sugar-specific transcriptional regulator TrmB
MDEITDKLIKLGLGDYEARVLGALIANSPASATFVAKKCNLSRSSVYTTLSSLIAKGLVSTTYKNEVKQFIAEDYHSLGQLLKKQKKDLDDKWALFESMKGSLKTLSSTQLHLPNIIFFEGQEGLKKIYLSMMRDTEPNSTLYLMRDEFVWQPDWKFIFEMEWHERVKRIKIEKNISTKLLVNDSPLERKKSTLYKSKKSLHFAFLPKKHSVKHFAIYILGDVVSILSMEHNNLVGIKITNQSMADNFKHMFEGLWHK